MKLTNKLTHLFIALLFILSGCATERVIRFNSDISPILKNKCQKCHLPPDGEGYVETGLNMESYDTLMDGDIYGNVIIPGDSKRSVLNKLVEGRAGEAMRMPHGDAKKLTAKEIEYFKLWVDQGALNN
ncbi:MAG: hypothetical protein LJE83_06015 [Gammaproteobacteria bacterium]|nr:hypothetical protein [Gammaproteobacteria bacterium]